MKFPWQSRESLIILKLTNVVLLKLENMNLRVNYTPLLLENICNSFKSLDIPQTCTKDLRILPENTENSTIQLMKNLSFIS